MPKFEALYISKLNNIAIIQDGESSITTENNEADIKNPKGGNKVEKLGAGQEVIDISFKSISDANSKAIRNALRSDKAITLLDKFNGNLKVTVTSYSITDSDKHIGVTKFTASFKIVEELKTPPQNISSKLKDNASLLSSAIDMTMKLDTANVINSAITNVKDSVSQFEDASNFATSGFKAIAEYRDKLSSIINSASALIQQPVAFKNKILGVISGFTTIYSTARQSFEVIKNIAVFKRDIEDSLSIFKRNEIENSNIVGNASNIAKASIMLETFPDITFNSMEEAKLAQSSIVETLDEIYNNDNDNAVTTLQTMSNIDLVETIKNDLSKYVQSLDLPNVVEVTVFQTPLIVLSYQLYGTTERVEELRALNRFFEDDNISGTIKVFDK
jgi:hypothetical protein